MAQFANKQINQQGTFQNDVVKIVHYKLVIALEISFNLPFVIAIVLASS